jgi:hypothetical protein
VKAPPIAPFRKTSLLAVTVVQFVNVPAPLKINAPLLVAFPKVKVPANE